METPTLGRPRLNPDAKKEKISASLDPTLLAWVQSRCGQGKEFASISHALERGIVALQEKMK